MMRPGTNLNLLRSQPAGWHARNGCATRPRPRIGRRRTPIVGGEGCQTCPKIGPTAEPWDGIGPVFDSNRQTGLSRDDGSPSQRWRTASTQESRGRAPSHPTERTQRGGGSPVRDGGSGGADRSQRRGANLATTAETIAPTEANVVAWVSSETAAVAASNGRHRGPAAEIAGRSAHGFADGPHAHDAISRPSWRTGRPRPSTAGALRGIFFCYNAAATWPRRTRIFDKMSGEGIRGRR